MNRLTLQTRLQPAAAAAPICVFTGASMKRSWCRNRVLDFGRQRVMSGTTVELDGA
jgi:hypothetical protein